MVIKLVDAHADGPGAQFKRTAAIQGDFVFHGPRRFFLKNRADKQKSWAFSTSFCDKRGARALTPRAIFAVYKRSKSTPYLGTVNVITVLGSLQLISLPPPSSLMRWTSQLHLGQKGT